MDLNIKRIENGNLPVYKREGDACLDCFARLASETIKIPMGSRCLVNLGFAIELPPDWEGVIRPRSGLSLEGLDCAIGTIDSNYRGEVKAVLINNSKGDYTIRNGERVCQLAIRLAQEVHLHEVLELSETERGDNGFGSSGK